MDKIAYINEIINFVEQFLDNEKIISDNSKQYNCIMCGRSRNNKPHMRIIFDEGFYYCYRCNRGNILYNLIKQFKTNANKTYVNNLLKIYFNFYKYDPSNKKIKNQHDYMSYDFNLNNIKLNHEINTELSTLQCDFFKSRFPNNSEDEILNLTNIFKLNLKQKNKIYYNSFYRKFAYCYNLFEDGTYKKSKLPNPNIVNDKKDYYYLINNVKNNNLYLSEGVIDLITVYITDPLYNSKESNYLAFCSRNYKFLFDILLNSGKFYYDNIYLILDNDISEEHFLNGVINVLTNNKSARFKIFNNLYIIKVPYDYIDYNHYYLHDNKLNSLLIKKIV
jgi:hypothetical protein